MREEYDFLTEARLLYTTNGGTHKLNIEPVQISESQLDAGNDSSETFAHFERAKEMSFTCYASLSKEQNFMLMLGPDRRKIRRAFRWYEKARRRGLPRECWILYACYRVSMGSIMRKGWMVK